MKTIFARSLATGVTLLMAGAAQAQTQSAVKDSTLATPSPDRPNTSPAEKKTASIAALEPIGQAARNLADDGVLLRATLTDEYAGNTSGGVRRGTTNTGIGVFGADLDLEKLVGWNGATIHVLTTALYGKSVAAEDVGNAIKFQGSYFSPQKFQLANFTLEQKLFGGKLNIIAGRTNATGPFAMPTYGCQFVNGSQCPNYLPLTVGQFSGYPYVTWGGRASVALAPHVHLSSGVYSIDPTRRNRHGFDIFDSGAVTGVTVPVQLDYGTDFSTDRYPRHFKLGGWYNSADYNDPYFNTNHQSRATFGGAPLRYDGGRGGVFALADQVIYRPDASRRNVAVFASISAPLDTRETLAAEDNAGVIFTGPFASRPDDTLAIQVTYLNFTDKLVAYENDLIAKAGGTHRINGDEVMLEADYGVALFRGAKITPTVQYVINPDITALPTQARDAPHNALVLGVRFSVNLGDILGLPPALTTARRR